MLAIPRIVTPGDPTLGASAVSGQGQPPRLDRWAKFTQQYATGHRFAFANADMCQHMSREFGLTVTPSVTGGMSSAPERRT